MENEVNERLINSLQIILNKKQEDFTENDFSKINNLSFSKMNRDGKQIYSFEELLKFKNLQTLSIENSKISLQDIALLSKFESIENITFNHCFFENDSQNTISSIKKLKNLSLKNSYINDYSKMFDKLNLISLEISFPYNEQIIKIENLENLSNLQFLTLEGCNIEGEKRFRNFEKIEILYLISTEVRDLTFINEMAKLSKIYLSPKYVENIDLKKYQVRVLTSGVDLAMDDEFCSKGII